VAVARAGGIDPSLFFDDDGRVYLTSTYDPGTNAWANPDTTDPGWGIQQSEIDIATGGLLTEPRVIWSGIGGSNPEGPHLYKIDGRYYLMIAEGGTEYGHMETIARSDTPWGPWEPCPHNPILSHRSLHSSIQATGHADLVQAQDGSWWLVCLGVRPQPFSKLHHLGRETFLAPVAWDADGWPRVGDNGHIALSMEGPNVPEVTWPAPAPRDDFDQPTLGLDWNFLRWPRAEDWSLTARPGFLRLIGNAARLDDGSGVAFVGRRQEHAQCEAATRLEYTPQADGQEAGLAVWMNQSHHYEIAVTRLEGERQVIVRRRIGTLAAVVASEPLADGPVTLQVRAAQQAGAFSFAGIPTYTFSYALAEGEPRELASGEARYLASEVAGGFTGVYFALYATANGEQTAAPADFDWFEYRAS
jgi:xylan 1,4-beta-xylosidase